jgi:alpha-beta hydrolase superfamily lysophospholipase
MALHSRPRLCLGLALGVALSALSALPAQTAKSTTGKAGAAKDKDKDKGADGKSRSISFRSSDGVELQGNFYPAPPSGAKDACVLLLHNINARTGGDSHADGWDHLAGTLQKEGYAVLTFDFRGFGKSKTVDKEFWNRAKNPQNQTIRNALKMPETIDRADFRSDYYPNLVNDVAAAKAYLDRKNDGRELNASNLVVIGAGEGATLGALWLASEAHRKKDRASATPGLPPDFDQPELRDVSCAVWLSISPTLATRQVPVKAWLTDVGRDQKVPMAFVYGSKDEKAKNFAVAAESAIKPKTGTKKYDPKDTGDPRAYTGLKKLDTSLSGSQLLQRSLDTEKWVVKTYLADLFDARPLREWRKRDAERFAYVWAFPQMRPMLAKAPGEEAPRALPLSMFFRNQ